MTSTLLTELREPVRVLLGDYGYENPLYEDTAIDGALRYVVRSGKLTDYSLDPTLTAVTPALSTPLAYGIMAVEAAVLCATPKMHAQIYQRRGQRFTSGERWRFVAALQDELYRLRTEETGPQAARAEFMDWMGQVVSTVTTEADLYQGYLQWITAARVYA